MDQFYVKDPLFPPEMFNSRIFSLNVISGSLMSFTRGSITYIMILFLQGPYGMNPQQAGRLNVNVSYAVTSNNCV